MRTMKAAIYTGIQEIEIQDVEHASPPPGFVVVDAKCTGVCGSDLHNYYGEWPPAEGLAQGHETCGIIAEIGEDVSGLNVGDKVAIECFSHCGICVYCETGHYNHCLNRRMISHGTHGGFSQYTTAHASGLFKLPDTMTFEEGALVEPLAVGVRAIAQAGATFQDRVAVIGGGTIGLVCLAAAKAMGVGETLITVKYEQQARAAEAFGADHIVNINDVDVKDYVKELTGNIGMDAVIETVGGAQQFNDTMAIVRRRGSVVLVAGYFKPLEINLAPMVWSEAMITGSNCYGYSGMKTDFQTTIDLISSGRIDPTIMVTHRLPFADIAEAFKIAADKKTGSIKVHVTQ